MSEPLIAQRGPFEAEVKAGKSYAWCACGRSRKQPFCDGSHASTAFRPVVWKAKEDETIWLCGCKRTGSQPLCDGTHATL